MRGICSPFQRQYLFLYKKKECYDSFAVTSFCNEISFDTFLTKEDLHLVAGFIGSNLQVTTSNRARLLFNLFFFLYFYVCLFVCCNLLLTFALTLVASISRRILGLCFLFVTLHWFHQLHAERILGFCVGKKNTNWPVRL